MIQLREVNAWLNRRHILRNISLDFPIGCTALLGPNGAGKSSLLRLCADGGLINPEWRIQGQITWQHTALHSMSAIQRAQHRAFLAQEHRSNLGLSVGDLLCLAAWPHGGGRNAPAHYEETLQMWDLMPYADTRYDRLSGGERQRVQLARTWLQRRLSHHTQGLWLLDEPHSALDLKHQHQLLDALHQAVALGDSVVFSTHDLNFAQRAAQYCVLMKEGSIIAQGPTTEVLTPALLETVFDVAFSAIPALHQTERWLIPQRKS